MSENLIRLQQRMRKLQNEISNYDNIIENLKIRERTIIEHLLNEITELQKRKITGHFTSEITKVQEKKRQVQNCIAMYERAIETMEN